MSLSSSNFNLLDLSYLELKTWLKSVKEPVERADLIIRSIYRQPVTAFDQIMGLPLSLKKTLEEKVRLNTIQLLDKRISRDGQTSKALFLLDDGKTIESTLMLYRNPVSGRERRTVCVSSQVGCPIGCAFCNTGQQGFERNLRTGEILEQILYFARDLGNENCEIGPECSSRRITNVVFMGMGEPLANYDNVVKAVAALNSPKGLGLGNRQVTLSTCGLTPQIRQLAAEDLHFELAISLHSVADELRDRMVPSNRKYCLSELMSASHDFFKRTGRRPFFEYALFEGLNDSEQDVEDLIRWLGDFKCSINLIVGNPTPNPEFRSSSIEVAVAFQKRLLEAGFRTMIRAAKGADIEAACGQLRSRHLNKFKDPSAASMS